MNNNTFVTFKLMHVFFLLTLVILSACGRRGDPVPVFHFEEMAVEKKADEDSKEAEEPKKLLKEDVKAEPEEVRPVIYSPPAGLTAVYTGKTIVLSWDEVMGRNVRGYNIYRSVGEEFSLIGKSAIPAFNDRKIKPDTTYYYKISVVGTSESIQSEKIEIVTEMH